MPKHHADEWERIQRAVEKSLPNSLGVSALGRIGGPHHWVPNADVFEMPDRLVVKIEASTLKI